MGTCGKTDPATEITNEIIALLQTGTMPWRRPWKIAGGGMPLRSTGDAYQGINAFLLGIRAAIHGYSSPYWLTFQQAKKLDAHVRKGEKSSLVVYYGTARKRRESADGDAGGEGEGQEAAVDSDGYRFLKSYRVFNAAQIEGLEAEWHPEPEAMPKAGAEPIPELQEFFEAIDIETRFGGNQACYIADLDLVRMPEFERFDSANLFYATWAHELSHATKSPGRLNRSFGASSFGNEPYSKEEICVEFAAVLLGQRLGFTGDHIENHAAYIGSWLKILGGDRRFLFTAAAHAQRAVDYLVAASESGRKAQDPLTSDRVTEAA
ncbi:ArdC family protein [Palleronia caenipelagi]|uniref:DUF1738 domain-containing protein n=1 Tax=Palleronia caenipelagi TaxID=2489174 RepID=A0A547PT25_9RHOB|nr:zincin-like metallopeptidase domain-containing protein [Palleronia caenipelagi]TRD17297.1 DUF1738 domain-containing protein [Palleronia caenipelagi]